MNRLKLTRIEPGGYLQWEETDNSRFIFDVPNHPRILPEICRLFVQSMIPTGISVEAPRTVYTGMTHSILQSVGMTYFNIGPGTLEGAKEWYRQILLSVVPRALIRLGEAGTMDDATHRCREILETYSRECPDWGAQRLTLVRVVGQVRSRDVH